MLTRRQKQIFDYLKKFIKDKGYSPSLEEIRRHFRLSSIATIHQHLENLKAKGYLEKLKNQPRSIEISKKPKSEDLVKIPVLGTIAAGKPIEAIEDKEVIKVSKSRLSKSGEHYALRVRGDSMVTEGIFDGDTVIIRKQPDAENGETVVALINSDEVTLKKIYKEKNRFRLQPANPKLKPIFTKELIIQGKVVSVIRKFEELKNLQKQTQKRKRERKKINKIQKFIDDKKSNLKMIWGDSEYVLSCLKDESIDVMVTSPPYFNAREYSTWKTLDDYLDKMKGIFQECYRILGNHRVFVLNVGDVNCQLGKQPWTKRRVPLGALFTIMFQKIGFEYVDDFIWDKGEPQSYRHKNGKRPYPMYQYPVNCYEHILIFHKHRRDLTRISCPVCGSKHVQNNSQSEIGVQSWECNNQKCSERSAGNRGKRFSARSIMMQNGQKKKNIIEEEFIKKWRRDIVKFSPVIKFGPRGKNRFGHTAPFPIDIPKLAVKYYSYIGDKVLDPFSGSFTTAIVAKKLNRIGIGIDINKKLFQNTVKERVIKEFGQATLNLFKSNNRKSVYKELSVL
ncbi:MAG: transcriptional repressor LexA [Candidatus Nealsonbacteria bacterium]